jgi:WD40 repeat protein
MVATGGLDDMCTIYALGRYDDANGGYQIKRVLSGHEGYISNTRFLSDSQIITASGDHTCRVWDVEMGKCTHLFKGHTDAVMCVATGSSRDTFISGSCDSLAKLWDARTAKCVQTFGTFADSDINAITMFPDSNSFCTGSDNAISRMYDIRAGQMIQEFQNDTIVCGVTSLAYSVSGRLLYAGYADFNCNIWDTLTGERVGILAAHNNRVSTLGVSDNGSALATGSWDSMLKVWTA